MPPYYCGYADARGEDQCDNCGKLLNPTELKGLITDGAAEQLHSVKAGKLLADRPVEGHHVPPYYCGYADARGEDQCDNCGKLLSPTEPKGLSTCAPRGRALTMCWFRLSVR